MTKNMLEIVVECKKTSLAEINLLDSLNTNSLERTVNKALEATGLTVRIEMVRDFNRCGPWPAKVVDGSKTLFTGINMKQAKIWLLGYLAGRDSTCCKKCNN